MPDNAPDFYVRPWGDQVNWLIALPVTAIAICATIALLHLVSYLELLRCPSSTFLAGMPDMGTAIQGLTIFAASMAPSALAVNWLVHTQRVVRTLVMHNSQRPAEPDYDTAQRELAQVSKYGLLIAIPIVVAAPFPRYCLAPTEVIYQQAIWQATHRLTWKDLEGIKTSCRKGFHGRWSRTYVLTFNDDTQFNVLGWTSGFRHAYPELAKALQNQDFWFNDRGVAASCDLKGFSFLMKSSMAR